MKDYIILWKSFRRRCWRISAGEVLCGNGSLLALWPFSGYLLRAQIAHDTEVAAVALTETLAKIKSMVFYTGNISSILIS
jgi:hypothetical protein